MLSLIIPTYNEKPNIAPLVEQVHAALRGRDYEMLFVDDDSPDGTAAAVEGLAGRYPVRVMVRRDQRGLASAVVDGIAACSGDVIGVMDADLQHPPEVLAGLADAIEAGADLAVASRYVNGGGCRGWSLFRRVMSRGAGLISHLFLPATRQVHDPMSGCFMFRRSVTEGAALAPAGYKILLEVLVKGSYGRVAEVPYVFQCRREGSSKLGINVQLDYLRHVYRLMSRRRELWRFVKFCLVGGSGVLVNEGLLWLLTDFAGFYYLASAAIGIEVSIITNFLLNDRFTFADRRAPGGFLRRLGKFNLVSLVALAVNMALLWFLTSVAGLHYLVSNLIGIAVAAVLNYLLNTLWTWR
jgi:dolichol-phosphate mannosyltransferase